MASSRGPARSRACSACSSGSAPTRTIRRVARREAKPGAVSRRPAPRKSSCTGRHVIARRRRHPACDSLRHPLLPASAERTVPALERLLQARRHRVDRDRHPPGGPARLARVGTAARSDADRPARAPGCSRGSGQCSLRDSCSAACTWCRPSSSPGWGAIRRTIRSPGWRRSSAWCWRRRRATAGRSQVGGRRRWSSGPSSWP